MSHQFTIENPMAPPWFVYPQLPFGSINWSMGEAEKYLWAFSNWLDNLPFDEQTIFQECFPAPKAWSNFYQQFGQFTDDLADGDDNIYEGENHSITLWEEQGIPKYSVDWLLNNGSENNEFVHFWGHKTSANTQITKSCFSQWWLSDFSSDSVTYCCMEQYMMAEKARLFGDKETEALILSAKEQDKIKGLGRKVKNFDSEIWDQVKTSIVLNGNYLKFSQNSSLRQFLIETQGKILVEASPVDWIWGIGFTENDASAVLPNKWLGENRLGFALMEVRDEISRVYRSFHQVCQV